MTRYQWREDGRAERRLTSSEEEVDVPLAPPPREFQEWDPRVLDLDEYLRRNAPRRERGRVPGITAGPAHYPNFHVLSDAEKEMQRSDPIDFVHGLTTEAEWQRYGEAQQLRRRLYWGRYGMPKPGEYTVVFTPVANIEALPANLRRSNAPGS